MRWSCDNISEGNQMVSVKERASQTVQALPDDCTWDDVLYEMMIRQQVDEGIRAADEGRVVSHEEAKRQVAQWVASYGPNPR
jgi:predicted transcriptional regulator